MTTFYKEYDFTAEQRSLLRDLIVCEMSRGPVLKNEKDILQMLDNGKKVKGDDCIIFKIEKMAKMCIEGKEQAVRNIMNRYSVAVIEGFLELASLDGMRPNSTNNFWE